MKSETFAVFNPKNIKKNGSLEIETRKKNSGSKSEKIAKISKKRKDRQKIAKEKRSLILNV